MIELSFPSDDSRLRIRQPAGPHPVGVFPVPLPRVFVAGTLASSGHRLAGRLDERREVIGRQLTELPARPQAHQVAVGLIPRRRRSGRVSSREKGSGGDVAVDIEDDDVRSHRLDLGSTGQRRRQRRSPRTAGQRSKQRAHAVEGSVGVAVQRKMRLVPCHDSHPLPNDVSPSWSLRAAAGGCTMSRWDR